jgi:transcriptional regulator with XRE-family HTH domain
MPIILTPAQLGSRLKQLRESRSITQQELADLLKIPRTAITQLESGARRMTVDELQIIGQHFAISMDAFLSPKGSTEVTLPEVKETLRKAQGNRSKGDTRIAVSKMDIPKFKTVLLYILEQCAGRPNVGDTVLRKLLYFTDFDHYELYEGHLTGARYKRMPYGPVPVGIEQILESMIKNDEVQRIKTTYFDKPQQRYIPLVKPDMTKLNAAEKEVIDRVINRYADWSAKSLSEHSHNDMPWKVTKEGQYICGHDLLGVSVMTTRFLNRFTSLSPFCGVGILGRSTYYGLTDPALPKEEIEANQSR